jgi:hypothetical protein
MLSLIDGGCIETYTNPQVIGKILSSHRWVEKPRHSYMLRDFRFSCNCGATLVDHGGNMHIYKNLICLYSEEEHMVIDIIC